MDALLPGLPYQPYTERNPRSHAVSQGPTSATHHLYKVAETTFRVCKFTRHIVLLYFSRCGFNAGVVRGWAGDGVDTGAGCPRAAPRWWRRSGVDSEQDWNGWAKGYFISEQLRD